MATLEFEALLEDGVIHVPKKIAGQLEKGAAVRVSTAPLQKPTMTPDEAWESIPKFVDERMALPPTSDAPNQFNREELSDHLTRYYGDSESD